MTKIRRYCGTSVCRLLPRLPRNLVLFDGHCLMSQARVRYVLERNFSFFHFRSLLVEDAALTARRLEQHALYFSSLDSPQGRDIVHRFVSCVGESKQDGTTRYSGAVTGKLPPTSPRVSDNVAVVLVEKVPTRHWKFLRRRAARTAGASNDDILWRNSTQLKVGRDASAKDPLLGDGSTTSDTCNHTELVVSSNFYAMCRIGMHLDRFIARLFFRLLFVLTPEPVASFVFRKCVLERRRVIWGTSEEDALKVWSRIEGIRERRWQWGSPYKRK